MFTRFWGHTKLTNIPFLEQLFLQLFFAHQFWPLRTSTDSFWGKKLHCGQQKIRRMRLRPKTSKYIFEIFQKIQQFENGKSGGLVYQNWFQKISPHNIISDSFFDPVPRGVFLKIPWFIVEPFGSALVAFGIFLSQTTTEVHPLGTRICKAPVEQPQTPSSTKNKKLTRATCRTLPQALRLIDKHII